MDPAGRNSGLLDVSKNGFLRRRGGDRRLGGGRRAVLRRGALVVWPLANSGASLRHRFDLCLQLSERRRGRQHCRGVEPRGAECCRLAVRRAGAAAPLNAAWFTGAASAAGALAGAAVSGAMSESG